MLKHLLFERHRVASAGAAVAVAAILASVIGGPLGGGVAVGKDPSTSSGAQQVAMSCELRNPGTTGACEEHDYDGFDRLMF